MYGGREPRSKLYHTTMKWRSCFPINSTLKGLKARVCDKPQKHDGERGGGGYKND